MKIFKFFLAVMVMITLCGCAESNTNETPADMAEITAAELVDVPDGYVLFEKKTNAIKDVAMELIDVCDTSAKVKITNNLDRTIDVDCVFEVQKKLNDNWYELPYVEHIEGFLGHANPIESQCSRDIESVWESLYGELEPGEYRIVTCFIAADESGRYYVADYNYYLSAEFEIS
ncbi:MAG: hypothetical protein K2N71_12145 [Oscillospiraceae bacterium]|nr:hypothetical protein [Oscillospiraceae bacterium]